MTVCYDAGTLQAFLDGEVTSSEKDAIEKHLSDCPSCRQALEELRGNQSFANGRLAGYMLSLSRAEVDTDEAWRRFSGNRPVKDHRQVDRKGVLTMFARYRAVATAAAMVLVLSAAFSFSSVRAVAGELLTIFRVEKVKTVNISPGDISRIERAVREGAGQIDIENFGRLEFKGKEPSGAVSLAEARGAVDFSLKLPASLPEGYRLQGYHKNGGGTLDLTLDTVKTNQILKSLGSEKLLPDQLNGRTFTVVVPTAINARYAGPNDSNVMIYQSRSPELVAPVTDVAAIRDALLALPFLPESLRSQLAAVNDWQHTFLVPNVGGTSREVEVAGSQGVFVTPPDDTRANGRSLPNSLIWQRGGVVYCVSGSLTLEQALEIAASMR